MGYGLTDLSFEEWITHIFDHPVTDPAWHWDMNAEWWSSSSEEQVSYMRQLFENAGTVLARYSDAQVNQGLWYMVNSATADYMRVLEDADILLEDRKQCIQSIFNLYTQVFAQRCSRHLSHLIRSAAPKPEGLSDLNTVCYMWWDIIPIYGVLKNYIEVIDRMDLSLELRESIKEHSITIDTEDHREMERSVLELMKRTLEIDHLACQESSLHGLGHWQKYFPKEVSRIVENWLIRNPNISEELRLYAERAQSGRVL